MKKKGAPRDAFCTFAGRLTIVADIGVSRETGAACALLKRLRFRLAHRAAEADEVGSGAARAKDFRMKTAIMRIDAIGLRLGLRLMVVGPRDDVPAGIMRHDGSGRACGGRNDRQHGRRLRRL